MSLDGYTPHTFLPTGEDTRILVPLAPALPAPTAAPEKTAQPDKGPVHTVRAAAPPPVPPPAPKPPAPSLDINTAR